VAPGGMTRLTMFLDGKQVWTQVTNVSGVYPEGWERGVAVVSATGAYRGRRPHPLHEVPRPAVVRM